MTKPIKYFLWALLCSSCLIFGMLALPTNKISSIILFILQLSAGILNCIGLVFYKAKIRFFVWNEDAETALCLLSTSTFYLINAVFYYVGNGIFNYAILVITIGILLIKSFKEQNRGYYIALTSMCIIILICMIAVPNAPALYVK